MPFSHKPQMDKLRRLLIDYYDVTGQRIGIFDADGRLLMVHPEPHCAFCSWIRSSETGRLRCRACDTEGMREANRTGKPVVYRCHAGLIEVGAPILEEDGSTGGYIMFGQLLYDVDLTGQWEETRRRCADIFPDTSMLQPAFHRVRRLSPGYIEATTHILDACVGYIRLERLMKRRQGGLWEAMQTYIERHLTRPFTLAEMAEELNVSVATLCAAARDNSGKTIGRITLEGRLSLALELLEKTDLPISEVAERAGIPDYNYFSRLFRREKGLSPREYRTAHRAGHLPAEK